MHHRTMATASFLVVAVTALFPPLAGAHVTVNDNFELTTRSASSSLLSSLHESSEEIVPGLQGRALLQSHSGDKPGNAPITKHLQDASFDSRKPQQYEAQLLQKVEAISEQSQPGEKNFEDGVSNNADPGQIPRIYVGITSAPQYFDRRQGIRKSWANFPSVLAKVVQYKFFVGRDSDTSKHEDIIRENLEYNDIILNMDYTEHYGNTSWKVIDVFDHGVKSKAPFIMKVDDDTFVFVEDVLEHIDNLHCEGQLGYIGMFSPEPPGGQAPHRNPKDKWYISLKEYPEAFFKPYAQGPGYLLTAPLAEIVVDFYLNQKFERSLRMDDVVIGLWMDQLIKKEGYDVKFLPSRKFHNYACEADSITAHYQSPEKMICMWEKWKGVNGKQYSPIHQFRRILLDKLKLSSRCC